MRNDKIVLTSKSRLDTKAHQRKPVKECYCISEMPERSESLNGREEKKNACEKHARELVEIYCSENAETGKSSLIETLLGCETLRRAGRITYLPNSEFLRRVQGKVYCHGRKKSARVFSDVSSSPSCGESEKTIKDKKTIAAEIGDCEKSKRNGGVKSSVKSSRSGSLENSTKSRENEKKMERQREAKGKPKVVDKKMEIRGDGIVVDKGKSRKIVRTISAQSRCCNAEKKHSGAAKKVQNIESRRKELERNSYVGDCDCQIGGNAEMSGETRWRLSRDRMNARAGESEERVRELNKFRRANYFETHGSVDTLVGRSRSSMQQTINPCDLNDRLFAAGVSGGKNVKRIHYYPSYVVREEKQTDDTGCRKKIRSRSSCDLIGHVIDLGVLKIPCDFSNNFFFNCHKQRSEEND